MKYISTNHKFHYYIPISVAMLLLINSCTVSKTALPPLDLSILFNKLFDTLLDIVVVLIGFVLLNVFWTRQEERRKALPHKEYLKTQVRFIENLSNRSVDLIRERFSEDESFKVNERNRQIQEHINVLNTISESIDRVLTSNYEKLDTRTSQGFAFFHTYIRPTINILVAFNQKETQPYLSKIEAEFTNLTQNTTKLRLYLQELSNDLDPSFQSGN